MLRMGTVALCGLMLSGCAGEMIKTGMQGVVGKPLNAAITKLGMPTDERESAGRKVYTWYSGRLIEGTTSQCRIRAMVQSDVIESWDYEGNEGACMRYAMLLDR